MTTTWVDECMNKLKESIHATSDFAKDQHNEDFNQMWHFINPYENTAHILNERLL